MKTVLHGCVAGKLQDLLNRGGSGDSPAYPQGDFLKATYINHMGSDASVVNSARVSTGRHGSRTSWVSETNLNAEDTKLIKFLANHQHYTPFEHCVVTLHLKVPIFAARQIQRHRAFSYNEVSRRYVKGGLEFYWPSMWRASAPGIKQGSLTEPAAWMDEGQVACTQKLVEELAHNYNEMLDNGVCAEQARMILPQNLYTEFYMTGEDRPAIQQ